jgi:hypothetical protein
MPRQLHPPTQPCPQRPHWTPSWIVEDGRILGAVGPREGLGLDRVLLVCSADNLASARTIERCGGALEGIAGGRLGPHRRVDRSERA